MTADQGPAGTVSAMCAQQRAQGLIDFGADEGADRSALPAYQAFLSQVDRYPVLSPEEQLDLVRTYQAAEEDRRILAEGDPRDRRAVVKARRKVRAAEEALELLVGSNLRLVLLIARELGQERRGDKVFEILPDLVQEGNLALMDAVKRFDPTLGTPFHTYAGLKIRQYVRDALAAQSTVKVPDSWTKLAKIASGVRGELHAELGRSPTIDEIKERAYETCMAWAYRHLPDGYDDPEEAALAVLRKQGILAALKNIEEVLRLVGTSASLDAPVGDEDSGTTLRDTIADAAEDTGMAEVERAELREALMLALSGFSDREREIILLRYGFDGSEPWTYTRLGQRFGVSSERIRQLEQRVLKKMASPHAQYVHLAAHLDSQVDQAIEDTEEDTSTLQRLRALRTG